MTERKPENALARVLTDLGPLIVFLAVNWISGVFVATAAFMIAIVAALVFSKLRFGHVSPMLWFSAVMVVALGALTLWLHDATFIKIKPTIYYTIVAAVLGFGFFTGRPLLKAVLGNAYPEMSDNGWRKLGRNFALFFVLMALLNETVWRLTAPDRGDDLSFWLGFKLWGAFPLTLLFGLANVPMILRHSATTETEPPVPPVG